jgi:hypothetical protein
MNKHQIGQVIKIMNWLLLIAGIVFLLFSAAALFSTLNLEIGKSTSFRTGRGLNKQAGTFAEFAGIGAGVLWLIRKIMINIKTKDSLVKEWLRQLFMVFRKHHIFLGITTLVITLIHGLYFLLFRNVKTDMGPRSHDTTFNFYSGVVSFFALAFLALLGWHHQANRKTKQNQPTKKRHIIASLVFGILAIIHIYIV